MDDKYYISLWFWEFLESFNMRMDDLADELGEIGKELVLRFCFEYKHAASNLEPIYYDIAGDELGEFTEWVVSNGRTFYQKVHDEKPRYFLEMDYNDEKDTFWESNGDSAGFISPLTRGYIVLSEKFNVTRIDSLDIVESMLSNSKDIYKKLEKIGKLIEYNKLPFESIE